MAVRPLTTWLIYNAAVTGAPDQRWNISLLFLGFFSFFLSFSDRKPCWLAGWHAGHTLGSSVSPLVPTENFAPICRRVILRELEGRLARLPLAGSELAAQWGHAWYDLSRLWISVKTAISRVLLPARRRWPTRKSMQLPAEEPSRYSHTLFSWHTFWPLCSLCPLS